MGAIPEECPMIDETKFTEWYKIIYNDFDTKFEDKVNEVIMEGASKRQGM